ncbi:uncharacterized protein LOC107274163 [Cephus cinctus]|uniref:Uncharacterized protein LOC107274163 n=1 Tax=Cephus cinctus TaxID=211228 RepID=A0AAJ7CE03_CEPCN|nr:uncharacterized protein LOC107274163 [Cephus cinctus]
MGPRARRRRGVCSNIFVTISTIKNVARSDDTIVQNSETNADLHELCDLSEEHVFQAGNLENSLSCEQIEIEESQDLCASKPCDSSSLGISIISNQFLSSMTIITASKIKRKCIKLKHSDSAARVVIPLLHINN